MPGTLHFRLRAGFSRLGGFAGNGHSWDGRDAAGAATPAGIYFARVEAAGRVLTRRIARIE